MFRFVYALGPDAAWDPALTADGIVAAEATGPSLDTASGESALTAVTRDGCRLSPAIDSKGNYDLAAAVAGIDAGYVVLPPTREPGHQLGRRLHALAESRPTIRLLIENSGAFTSALDLWTLAEAAHHPRVVLALDIDAATTAGETAAVLVPTLNLRIGLVRARTLNDALGAFARRLAGIGFEGPIVLDPPPGPDRITTALAIASLFRAVLPVKAVKKAPAPKATPVKAAGS